MATSGTLTLVREKNLADLFPKNAHYEASGIALQNDSSSLRVVFDNSTQIASVDVTLLTGQLGPGGNAASQYEGITLATHPTVKTFIVVEEAGPLGRSSIVTMDDHGKFVSTEPTDVTFADENKGIEGIAWLDDIERLLVLCEANSCGRGDERPGHGMLKSLRRESGESGGLWRTETTLAIPARADFEDYSDLAVLHEGDGTYRMAVVSQQSAALWVGTLTTNPLAISGAGAVYGLPKIAGKNPYCSIEGVTFLDRSTVALASDRLKNGGASGCSKAEAIHIFALPTSS